MSDSKNTVKRVQRDGLPIPDRTGTSWHLPN
jgi:hypothetical protein